MARLGLETHIVDSGVHKRTLSHLAERKLLLPTLEQLSKPETIPGSVSEALESVGPDEANGLNLFRVHWYNDADRKTRTSVPNYVELPPSLTGVESPILVAFGNRFPMINAHKVLAAYGCLVPRLVTGQYDPTQHRAIWPSTGNYCRGGVAISRLLGVRGVAVLPEGMSEERFNWLARWVEDPGDVVRTVGTESNVKEIYDKCNELDESSENIIFNQFCEFGNHLVHWSCTGPALGHVYRDFAGASSDYRLAAFVSATGSAGTIGAGDYLKDEFGTRIVAAEALECPTMLYNGFGEHNIQGIGDKHIPYIHNVLNTDLAVAVSDVSTDSLFSVFNSEHGREFLKGDLGLGEDLLAALQGFGLSSICNVLGAIKTAKLLKLGSEDVLITVATDGAEMYTSELAKAEAKYFDGEFSASKAATAYGHHLEGADTENIQELSRSDRDRIFNLGYFTWVEQQGVSLAEFEARRDQRFWRGLRPLVPAWNQMIEEVNAATGVRPGQ